MTAAQFRSSTELTARFRELLNDAVMQQAIIILRDGRVPVDPRPGAEAIESVRMLSQMVGADSAINMLLSLADPLEPEVPILTEDWTPPEPPPENV